MTLCSKALMSKVGSCDLKGVVGVADNRGRFDNDQCRDQPLNLGRPGLLCKKEDIVI